MQMTTCVFLWSLDSTTKVVSPLQEAKLATYIQQYFLYRLKPQRILRQLQSLQCYSIERILTAAKTVAVAIKNSKMF